MRFFPATALCALWLSASAVHAQEDGDFNVFHGFDFVLSPISIKWACGGDAAPDLAHIDTLIAAYPEHAARADLPRIIAQIHTASQRPGAVQTLLGDDVAQETSRQLCAHALPLELTWITPDDLVNGEAAGATPEQADAWEAFFRLVESL